MKATIKKIEIENFKGCRKATYDFDGNYVVVRGSNASGKTTILDGFWWCLFNKDSLGNEKFSIRPLDITGKQIDNVEIKVVVTLDIDGEEKEFSKTQKQKWVKRRGSEVSELQGNENLYEIDGYPKSEKDYKIAVSEIVSEDVFKMVTNPAYFPSLKWKEQREILMKFVDEVSDVELAKSIGGFDDLLCELGKAPSTDDIKAKYQKSLNELKKKQAEIPVRIDEAEKSKSEIDFAELELQKNLFVEERDKTIEQQKDILKQNEAYSSISDDVMKLMFDKNDYIRVANEKLHKKITGLKDTLYGISAKIRENENLISGKKMFIKNAERNIEFSNRKLEEYMEEYTKQKSIVFDEDSLVCSYCGQAYPMEKQGKLIAEFEKTKSENLKRIMEESNDTKIDISDSKKNINEFVKEIKVLETENKKLEIEKGKAEAELSSLPPEVDLSADKKFNSILQEIEEKEKILVDLKDVEHQSSVIVTKIADINNSIAEIEKELAKAEINNEIDNRISELKAEQREIGNKVVEQEKMIYLVEQFIKAKMEAVSEKINSKFEGVSFKLFENQINGGLKETCELTVKGVPYGSLNAGHRIVAGMQIIRALNNLYDVEMPLFVDNAETVNDYNIPEMDCQTILLKVADCNLEIFK